MKHSEIQRSKKTKTATYNLTEEQLNSIVREKIESEFERMKKEATEDAINISTTLMLVLPLEVLLEYSDAGIPFNIQEFTDKILWYYKSWQDGELDMDRLKEDLWIYGGVRLEEER